MLPAAMKMSTVDRQDSKARRLRITIPFQSLPTQVPSTRSRCTPLSALKSLADKFSARSCFALVVLLLLGIVAILHFGSFLSGGQFVARVSVLAVKVSYLIGKEWRYQTGVYSANYTYPGIIPPYAIDSAKCSLGIQTPSPFLNYSRDQFDYDVCLVVSIGDDGDKPHETALPYPLASRLINVLQAEVEGARKEGRVGSDETVEVLVGVDYESVVCAMVRDAFYETAGVRVHCTGFSELDEGTKCGTLVAGQSEHFVSQVPDAWSEAVEWQTFRPVDLDCPDHSHQAPDLPEKDWQPTVVTGFSSNHMTVGLLLLRSIGKAAQEGRGMFNNISVVVWAMEVFDYEQQRLLDCVMHELNFDYGVNAEVRLFDWSAYPSWMRINSNLGYFGGTGEYAWKAIMVHTVLRERGFVLWADAGDRFRDTASLIESLQRLNSTGFVSRNSHGFVYTRTHPLALKYYRANLPGIWDLENCEAAIVGFTLKKYDELARPWYDCSITRQCIAPDGSDRSNHRQDQSALTLLSILSKNPCTGAHPNFIDHEDDDPTLKDVSGTYLTRCYVDPLVLSSQGTLKPADRPHGIID